MCLIVLSFTPGADPLLVIAANRDEYRARPTDPAGFWPDAPRVLAGRDRVAGGTWLGITRDGRFAALTNFRDPSDLGRVDAPSRGALVRDFLTGDATPEAHLAATLERGEAYAGFSLLVGDPTQVRFGSNRGGEPRDLEPGVHALSNHLLDTPWPKVRRVRGALEQVLERPGAPGLDELMGLLADDRIADDGELPETGVGTDMERLLSPIFIDTPMYGTRSSTVIVLSADGELRFRERTHHASAAPTDRDFSFRIGGVT